MASQTKYAGTVADDASNGGTVAWTNPTNAQGAPNGSYATAAFGGAGTSHYLKATNFGFNIPDAARIDGVQVMVTKKESGIFIIDDAAYLVVGGVIDNTHSGRNLTVEWPTVDTLAAHGGPGDLWGNRLTPADINASNFGFVLACRRTASTPTGSIDSFMITVFYTPLSADRDVTVVEFCSPRSPHGPELVEAPASLRYGFKVRGVQTASFLLSKASANVARFLSTILPTEPAMVRIRRPDGYLPWVGFVTGFDESAADPYATVQLADHAWRLQSPHGARTARSQKYQTASGRIIRDIFADMEQRAEPPLMLRYDTVGDGPPASHEVRMDYGLDLLEALAKQCDYEWGFAYLVDPQKTETHLTWKARQGVDRRGEEAWQEGKHFTAATYALRYANGIKSAVAVGGSGAFGSRPAVGVSQSGAAGDLTKGYARSVGRYGLGGTRIVMTQQTSDLAALRTMAGQLHDAPEWAAEAFTFRVLESAIDMKRFGLGDVRTIKRTILGTDIERVVRIIGIDMNPDTREHDVAVAVVA